jgi:outer membrane protein
MVETMRCEWGLGLMGFLLGVQSDALRLRWLRGIVLGLFLILPVTGPNEASADTVNLTLESAVEIAMRNSYRIRGLRMGIERTRLLLKGRQAQLKSSVAMNLKTPKLEAVSDYKWNSTLQRDEIVQLNSRLWEMELSISQPVILFGYPTNGYLSLNTRTYQYRQKEDGSFAVNYYNRHFVRFSQPLFQPNNLKNNIEDAELDLQQEELRFLADQARLVDDVADDYYDLFRLGYQDKVDSKRVRILERVIGIAERASRIDTTRKMEPVQAQVELGNAREQLARNEGRYRLEMERLKQRLGMENDEELVLNPKIHIDSVRVDVDKAIAYGLTLRPRLEMMRINRRKQEIDLDNSKGANSFRVKLEMTYGFEKEDEDFGRLWDEPTNSYSVSVNAYVPIWDWGRRDALIQAEELSVSRAELRVKEMENELVSDIRSAAKDLGEYQRRTIRMAENLGRAEAVVSQSLEQYLDGGMPLFDMLRSISMRRETELRFLDAYLGYRRAILSLMMDTYYDFENGIPLFKRFAVGKDS